MGYYATAKGYLKTAKVKTKNKIYDVENVQFLAQVYLDSDRNVYDYEDIIYLDYDLNIDSCHTFENEELIIENEKDIEWEDISIDYERDYDEERDEKLIQECE